MAILSKRLMQAVSRKIAADGGTVPRFLDLKGGCLSGEDPLGGLRDSALRRRYALQESVDCGEPYLYHAAPSVVTWVMALEHQRVISGSMLGVEVFVEESGVGRDTAAAYLAGQGMETSAASAFVARLPSATQDTVRKTAGRASELFYREGGWRAELMEERRQGRQRRQQLDEAVNEVRMRGEGALYAFEKERVLLSNIRAGDRNGARRILNEMLGTIYLSSPKPVVLRARVIELLSCLTRAAIEDNPMLEPLIERNHRWTDQLIHADGFEALSTELMQALDEFIDAVYLHGVNRSNVHVHKAMEFIAREFKEPISLSHVAAHVGLSSCRLAHLVKAFTGKTVLEVIRQVRLQRAQELLDRTALSGVEIAYEVGFGDQSYFIQHFKRYAGMTPARYRRRR
jgi:AraC-like DNA-binding protein